MFQRAFPFSIYCLFKSLQFYVKRKQFKRQQMAKINDRVPKERLRTSTQCRLNDVFLKISPYDPEKKRNYRTLLFNIHAK